jgi:hypothetical protein
MIIIIIDQIGFWLERCLTMGRQLILERHQQLIARAEGGHAFDVAGLVGKGHHRAVAVHRMASAGKIPLAAFVGRLFGLLGEMRRGLGLRRLEKLELGYGE